MINLANAQMIYMNLDFEKTKTLQKRPLEEIKNKKLRLFFSSLVEEMDKKYCNVIKSVIVFGSSVTDFWMQGRSDIDFIIIIESKDDVPKVTNYTNKLILSLNKKYNLGLENTCTTYAKNKNPLIQLIQKMESFFKFGAPFMVFSLDEIDFRSNKIKNFRINLITNFFDSLDIFVYKAKRQGVVLYGEDYLSGFKYKRSLISKLQTMIAPLWIMLVALFTAKVDKKFSIEHANKATIWATEDILFALDMDIDHIEKNIEKINSLFNCSFIKNHLDTTLKLKTLEDTSNLEYLDSPYTVDAFKFICYCYPKVFSRIIKIHFSHEGGRES